tara:strand:- start:270 stop:551 length:282 start_codon:yes stop_codon:yes gene_type:complete
MKSLPSSPNENIEMKLYKIRRKSDGLFSKGGIYNESYLYSVTGGWSKNGKLWTKPYLNSHLSLCKSRRDYRYKESHLYEIVVYELEELGTEKL